MERGLQSAEEMQHSAALIAALAAAAAAVAVVDAAAERHEQHTSVLTGHAWVAKLLHGNVNRMRNNYGVHPHTFHRLLASLEEKTGFTNSHWITKEQLVYTPLLRITQTASWRSNSNGVAIRSQKHCTRSSMQCANTTSTMPTPRQAPRDPQHP